MKQLTTKPPTVKLTKRDKEIVERRRTARTYLYNIHKCELCGSEEGVSFNACRVCNDQWKYLGRKFQFWRWYMMEQIMKEYLDTREATKDYVIIASVTHFAFNFFKFEDNNKLTIN